MRNAYIGLGSNLGDRLDNLKQAVILLLEDKSNKLYSCSGVYETDPVGGPEQDRFLNSCILVKTSLSPTVLLNKMLAVETELKRIRKERWGPRTIDLDLLVYDNITMNTPFLQLPHPRLTERDFVLVPLADIAPDLVIPNTGEKVKNILAGKGQSKGITFFCSSSWCNS